MIQEIARKGFPSLLFIVMVMLTACAGGTEDEQWPQPLAFTDFIGGQTYFILGTNGGAQTDCQTCISVEKVVRSSEQITGDLAAEQTSPYWPAPYNNRFYSELPIDYSSKMAVILQDPGSGPRYAYVMQNVEENAGGIIITVLKCMVYADYPPDDYTLRLGLLIPQSNKPIDVLTVQSGKAPLPEYGPNGLGAC